MATLIEVRTSVRTAFENKRKTNSSFKIKDKGINSQVEMVAKGCEGLSAEELDKIVSQFPVELGKVSENKTCYTADRICRKICDKYQKQEGKNAGSTPKASTPSKPKNVGAWTQVQQKTGITETTKLKGLRKSVKSEKPSYEELGKVAYAMAEADIQYVDISVEKVEVTDADKETAKLVAESGASDWLKTTVKNAYDKKVKDAENYDKYVEEATESATVELFSEYLRMLCEEYELDFYLPEATEETA